MFFLMTWAGQHVLRSLRVEVFRQLHRLSLELLRRARGRRRDEPHHQRHGHDPAGDQLRAGQRAQRQPADRLDRVQDAAAQRAVCADQPGRGAVHGRGDALVLGPGAQGLPPHARARSATSTPTCRRASPACARCRPSAARKRTSRASARSNAANRDANIRAVAFTAALAPTLEALGYVAMAIVAGGRRVCRCCAARRCSARPISLGLIITFLGYVQRFNQPIQQIAVLWTNIQSADRRRASASSACSTTCPTCQDKPDAQRDAARSRGGSSSTTSSADYETGEPVLQGRQLRRRAGPDGRHRRPDRRRQDDDHQPDPALLRCDRRRGDASTASTCAT